MSTPIGIQKEDVTMKRAESIQPDFLLTKIEAGQLYFYQEEPTVYLSTQNVINITNADTISEVDSVTPFMFNASADGQMCSLCGSYHGELSLLSVSGTDSLRIIIHESCLFEFAEKCKEILDENPEYAISELI